MLPKEKGEGLTTQLIVESQKITQMSPPPFLGFGSRAQIYTGSPLGRSLFLVEIPVAASF